MTFKICFAPEYLSGQGFGSQERKANIDDSNTEIDDVNGLKGGSHVIMNGKIPKQMANS